MNEKKSAIKDKSFELLKETKFLSELEFEIANNEAIEFQKMLRSAIITSKNNLSHHS